MAELKSSKKAKEKNMQNKKQHLLQLILKNTTKNQDGRKKLLY